MDELTKIKSKLQTSLPDEGIIPTIDALKKIIVSTSPRYKTLILLESQIKELQRQKQQGIIDYDRFKLEQNQVRKSLLDLFLDLETQDVVFGSSQTQPTVSPKRVWLVVGVLAALVLAVCSSLTLFSDPYEFIVKYPGTYLAARDDASITITQKSGKPCTSVYIEIDERGDYFQKIDSCNCWVVDLRRYVLFEGSYTIKIGLNQAAIQDDEEYSQNTIKIDNSIPEGLAEIISYETDADSVRMEVRGRANEKVNLDVRLPFSLDSVRINVRHEENQSGHYFLHQITMPKDLAERFKDEIFLIFIADEAGNQSGRDVTLNELQNSKGKFLIFGQYITRTLASSPESQPIDIFPPQLRPKEQPGSAGYDPEQNNANQDSLTFWISFHTPKVVGLNWRLGDTDSTTQDIEYTLYRRITKSIKKDTSTSFVPIKRLSSTSYDDSTINPGHVYEYYVKALDQQSQTVIQSRPVEQYVSLQIDSLWTKAELFRLKADIQSSLVDSIREDHTFLNKHLEDRIGIDKNEEIQEFIAEFLGKDSRIAELVYYEYKIFVGPAKNSPSHVNASTETAINKLFQEHLELAINLYNETHPVIIPQSHQLDLSWQNLSPSTFKIVLSRSSDYIIELPAKPNEVLQVFRGRSESSSQKIFYGIGIEKVISDIENKGKSGGN